MLLGRFFTCVTAKTSRIVRTNFRIPTLIQGLPYSSLIAQQVT
jgi:hypothetical protein